MWRSQKNLKMMNLDKLHSKKTIVKNPEVVQHPAIHIDTADTFEGRSEPNKEDGIQEKETFQWDSNQDITKVGVEINLLNKIIERGMAGINFSNIDIPVENNMFKVLETTCDEVLPANNKLLAVSLKNELEEG